jgi:hypothetical protein
MQTLTITSNTATLDWSLGSNGYVQSGCNGNYILDLSNFPTASNSAYEVKILYEQSNPGAYVSMMNVNSTAVTTFCFSNNHTPYPTPCNWEIQMLHVFYFTSSNIAVFGDFTTYCVNSNGNAPV